MKPLNHVIRKWLPGESRTVREDLVVKQLARFRACAVDCGFEGALLKALSVVGLEEDVARARIAILSFAFFCYSDQCVENGCQGIKHAQALVMRTVELSAPAYTSFADRGSFLLIVVVWLMVW
jgi:hypothetical protein